MVNEKDENITIVPALNPELCSEVICKIEEQFGVTQEDLYKIVMQSIGESNLHDVDIKIVRKNVLNNICRMANDLGFDYHIILITPGNDERGAIYNSATGFAHADKLGKKNKYLIELIKYLGKLITHLMDVLEDPDGE